MNERARLPTARCPRASIGDLVSDIVCPQPVCSPNVATSTSMKQVVAMRGGCGDTFRVLTHCTQEPPKPRTPPRNLVACTLTVIWVCFDALQHCDWQRTGRAH
jgi:hypothetical protein